MQPDGCEKKAEKLFSGGELRHRFGSRGLAGSIDRQGLNRFFRHHRNRRFTTPPELELLRHGLVNVAQKIFATTTYRYGRRHKHANADVATAVVIVACIETE